MYEKFTDRARKILQLANQEAQRFNHEYIGTEHILLGLVKEGTGVGSNVLKNFGVDLRKIRLEVEKLVQAGPEMITMGKLPQTPRAKRTIALAMEEATNLRHNFCGTEHVLLGLLSVQEGIAAQVLSQLDVKIKEARAEVIRLLGDGLDRPENERAANSAPTGPELPEWPYVPGEVKRLTRDLEFFRTSTQRNIDVCEKTLEQIKIGLRRLTANNLFLVGTPEQVNIYVEAIIRSGSELCFRDFAAGKYAFPVDIYIKQTLTLLPQCFRALATAIVFHNFHHLFPNQPDENFKSFGDSLGHWIEYPNLHLIAYGNQVQKDSTIGQRPHISRHFSVVELPPFTRAQIEAIVAREIQWLQPFHLCTFSDEAVALAIDICLAKTPEPTETREIVNLLDIAATKMQLAFHEDVKSAAELDDQITTWTEQFASSAIRDDLDRSAIESTFVVESFKARQKVKPFPVVGVEQIQQAAN